MTRVIKIGGRAQADERLGAQIARAAASARVCLVHGGGDEVSALMRRMGREPSFVNGRRVTTVEDIDLVRMVLSGLANKRLVSALISSGVDAVGVSGEDGGLISAAILNDGALGLVGDPEHVTPYMLQLLLDGGYVPVVSPVGRGPAGEALNINGDDAAAAIAAALGADELLLVADVPGVLDASGAPLAELLSTEVDRLVAEGVATGGMQAKLDACLRALQAGVSRVRIGNVTAIGDPRCGTSVRLSPSAV